MPTLCRTIVAFATLAPAVVGARVSSLAAQERPIAWSISAPRGLVRQGRAFHVGVQAMIPAGWHLYSSTQPLGGPNATTFAVAGDSAFGLAGPASARPPDVAPDNNFGIVTETYSDSVRFELPVVARFAGQHTLKVKVGFETCTDRYCLPLTSELLTVALQVAPEPGTTAAAAIVLPPPPTPAVSAAIAATRSAPLPGGTTQSLPLFLWLAAVMGALSLLTPCVFPMIPITVSYFTRTSETTRAHPARNALIFALGIVGTFTVLGMAIAVLVGAGGINRFAANPWVNLLVTAIFVAFAFNLFGFYQVALPAALVARLDGASRRAGTETAGILLMGLTFTLTSFTCTAPLVGTLLVMVSQGSWAWPLLGLLVFSGVFALPFFLLALMPAAVARLPRSGSWMQSVKVVMGFVELATAMKFLSNADLVLRWGIFTRTVVLSIWLAITLLTVLYLAGFLGWPGQPRSRPGAIRLLISAAVLLLGVYLGRGLAGHRLGELESFVPPPDGSVTSGPISIAGLAWMVNDLPGAMARGRAEHKQVLIDFTGYTCTNCRWMEANMFPRTPVRVAMERFIRVRLYTDGIGPVYEQQQRLEEEKLGTVALPYYAVMDSDGQVKARFLGMTRSTDDFVQFLTVGRSDTGR